MSWAQIACNPFLVLELAPDCARMEVERQGQKLLAMLAVGFAESDEYPTPFGPMPRTTELVREAMATLRDPRRRLVAEMWAQSSGDENSAQASETTEAEPEAGAMATMALFGLGRSR